MTYYPVFLKLKNKKAVVIGGGCIAERKIIPLIKSGADVTVVSPELTKRLLKEKKLKKIRHLPRKYCKKDLSGAFIVIAATDSPEINTKISKNTSALLNVVDDPSKCSFIAPAVINRENLIIAVSTSGASPALSKLIRKELEKLYGAEFTGYLKFLKKLREKAFFEIAKKNQRTKFLKSLASKEILHVLRTKGLYAVRKTVIKRFDSTINLS